MAQEKETTEYSGKVFKCSGGEDKWREWSIKTIAHASTRGWQKALLQDCKRKTVSDTPLTEEEIKDQAMNLKAWNHLVIWLVKIQPSRF
jgi:hypothetical protein